MALAMVADQMFQKERPSGNMHLYIAKLAVKYWALQVTVSVVPGSLLFRGK
jgi:hypothetical protein